MSNPKPHKLAPDSVSKILSHLKIAATPKILPPIPPVANMDDDTVSVISAATDPDKPLTPPPAPPLPDSLVPIPPTIESSAPPTDSKHHSQEGTQPAHPPILPPSPTPIVVHEPVQVKPNSFRGGPTISTIHPSPQNRVIRRAPRRRCVISRVRVLASGVIVQLPAGRRAHQKFGEGGRDVPKTNPIPLNSIRFPNGPPALHGVPNPPAPPFPPPF